MESFFMTFRLVGQVVRGGDCKFARIEVTSSRGTMKATSDELDEVIFATRYRNGQVGDRSIGLSADEARAVAALLLSAADSIASDGDR